MPRLLAPVRYPTGIESRSYSESRLENACHAIDGKNGFAKADKDIAASMDSDCFADPDLLRF
jgi:hypothetical protein